MNLLPFFSPIMISNIKKCGLYFLIIWMIGILPIILFLYYSFYYSIKKERRN